MAQCLWIIPELKWDRRVAQSSKKKKEKKNSTAQRNWPHRDTFEYKNGKVQVAGAGRSAKIGSWETDASMLEDARLGVHGMTCVEAKVFSV